MRKVMVPVVATLLVVPCLSMAWASRADREAQAEARHAQQKREQVRRSSQLVAEVLIQEELARLKRHQQDEEQQRARRPAPAVADAAVAAAPSADSGLDSVFGRDEHLEAPGRAEVPLYPAAPPAAPAVQAEVQSQVKVQAQPDLELFHSGYSKYSQGDYAAAREDFASFLAANPGDALADSAQYWLGQCAAAQGDDETALAEYQRVISSFPFGDKVPDALLKSGDMLSRLGREDEARQAWQELVHDFPQSGAARRAQTRLADQSS